MYDFSPPSTICYLPHHYLILLLPYKPSNIVVFHESYVPVAEPATLSMLHLRIHVCPLQSQPHRLTLFHFRTHVCPLLSQPHRLALLYFRFYVCPLPSQPHSLAFLYFRFYVCLLQSQSHHVVMLHSTIYVCPLPSQPRWLRLPPCPTIRLFPKPEDALARSGLLASYLRLYCSGPRPTPFPHFPTYLRLVLSPSWLLMSNLRTNFPQYPLAYP